ncbi:MAG: hypothetical protein K6E90_01125 [Lachnospiraceae bacterium]|nr:hypothetical protein [Lachnospiraceae bacterium]MCR5409561.1 hypothetical protein [Lachnospiraceae bacterium]
MIKDSDLYGIKHYLYGEAYYGSDGGMRFRLAREPLKSVIFKSEEERLQDDPKLRAEVWFGRLCYEKTPPEEITVKDFEFDESGYKAAVIWLNEMRDSH